MVMGLTQKGHRVSRRQLECAGPGEFQTLFSFLARWMTPVRLRSYAYDLEPLRFSIDVETEMDGLAPLVLLFGPTLMQDNWCVRYTVEPDRSDRMTVISDSQDSDTRRGGFPGSR